MEVTQGSLLPVGFQQITLSAAVTGLTVPAGARSAQIQCEAIDVRWRDDGVNPTVAIGMNLLANATLEYAGDLNAIKFVRTGAGSILNVSYYR